MQASNDVAIGIFAMIGAFLPGPVMAIWGWAGANALVAAAMLGLIAIPFPHIIGVGYETTAAALKGDLGLWTVIVFALIKAVAVAITLGGRMGGGVFSPALVMGALTGLAFTDVQHLRYEHIIKDVNGEYWIRKAREKTDNMCDIPLLDIPRMILEKYKGHPECMKKGVLLPVPSNQRMNSYLKEIADTCGITKPLSTHVARHTFATVALANKVSMESVAKMLGHTDIRTTRIYARILDKTVSEEMKGMRSKFVHL